MLLSKFFFFFKYHILANQEHSQSVNNFVNLFMFGFAYMSLGMGFYHECEVFKTVEVS